MSTPVVINDWIHRLRGKVQATADGCWQVMGKTDYPVVYLSGKAHPLHRIVYAEVKGGIPADWHVHHRCENKRCINPDHLDAMDPAEHMRLHRVGNQFA